MVVQLKKGTYAQRVYYRRSPTHHPEMTSIQPSVHELYDQMLNRNEFALRSLLNYGQIQLEFIMSTIGTQLIASRADNAL